MSPIRAVFLLCLGAVLCSSASAGLWPRTQKAYLGTTPKLDGVISPGEYDDATRFLGVRHWTHTFTPTTDPRDLALVGYVKHDNERLYFAFDVTDDILYGIDTPRWIPTGFPKVHELTPEGFPWFGDEMELLIGADNSVPRGENAEGNGRSWQMVCNLTKSRLGGIGVGGLLEGEPRSSDSAWKTYQKWILEGAQKAAAKRKPEGHGYVIEWAVRFNPCLEMAPGKFYAADMADTPMGLNIALGDLDEPEKGDGNFANFHHEDWFAGDKDTRTQKRQWGTLWMMKGPRPAVKE
jgi:SSS family solute:Na+ symporter